MTETLTIPLKTSPWLWFSLETITFWLGWMAERPICCLSGPAVVREVRFLFGCFFYRVGALLQKLHLSESRGLHFLLWPSYLAQALNWAQLLKDAAAIAIRAWMRRSCKAVGLLWTSLVLVRVTELKFAQNLFIWPAPGISAWDNKI